MIKLSLKQALTIQANNYKLSDKSRLPIDTYDGVTYSREELDQHIYKLQANIDAKKELEHERELRRLEINLNKQLKAFKTLLQLNGDSEELRTMIKRTITIAENYI